MGKIIYNSWKDLELILRPWAHTICMENPEIPGRIQMERFIPVEIIRKESNTFRGITFFRFYRDHINFLYHLFGLPVAGFKSRESENLLVFCKWCNSIPFPFSVPKNNTSTIWRKFFTDISVQMVSAPFIRHRNKLIILPYKWKPTNKWIAREASERYNYMTKIIFYCCSKQ